MPYGRAQACRPGVHHEPPRVASRVCYAMGPATAPPLSLTSPRPPPQKPITRDACAVQTRHDHLGNPWRSMPLSPSLICLRRRPSGFPRLPAPPPTSQTPPCLPYRVAAAIQHELVHAVHRGPAPTSFLSLGHSSAPSPCHLHSVTLTLASSRARSSSPPALA